MPSAPKPQQPQQWADRKKESYTHGERAPSAHLGLRNAVVSATGNLFAVGNLSGAANLPAMPSLNHIKSRELGGNLWSKIVGSKKIRIRMRNRNRNRKRKVEGNERTSIWKISLQISPYQHILRAQPNQKFQP
jgi:hypothetical protein